MIETTIECAQCAQPIERDRKYCSKACYREALRDRNKRSNGYGDIQKKRRRAEKEDALSLIRDRYYSNAAITLAEASAGTGVSKHYAALIIGKKPLAEIRRHRTKTTESDHTETELLAISEYSKNPDQLVQIPGIELQDGLKFYPKQQLLVTVSDPRQSVPEHPARVAIHLWKHEVICRPLCCAEVVQKALGNPGVTEWARKCNLVSISSEDARVFCNENSIQGYPDSDLQYGLVNARGSLVAVACFRESPHRKGWLELTRYSERLGMIVVGGLTKICSGTERTQIVVRLKTRYENVRDWEQAGFKKERLTKPVCSWWKDGLVSRGSSVVEMTADGWEQAWEPAQTILIWDRLSP